MGSFLTNGTVPSNTLRKLSFSSTSTSSSSGFSSILDDEGLHRFESDDDKIHVSRTSSMETLPYYEDEDEYVCPVCKFPYDDHCLQKMTESCGHLRCRRCTIMSQGDCAKCIQIHQAEKLAAENKAKGDGEEVPRDNNYDWANYSVSQGYPSNDSLYGMNGLFDLSDTEEDQEKE